MVKKGLLIALMIFLFLQVSAESWKLYTADSLKVYPNPATDVIKIDFYTDDNIVPKLRILDLTGKVVLKEEKTFTAETGKYRAEMDISGLSAGIYFIKVIQGEAVLTRRLVVR